jgi:hypothetical protein
MPLVIGSYMAFRLHDDIVKSSGDSYTPQLADLVNTFLEPVRLQFGGHLSTEYRDTLNEYAYGKRPIF